MAHLPGLNKLVGLVGSDAIVDTVADPVIPHIPESFAGGLDGRIQRSGPISSRPDRSTIHMGAPGKRC